MYYVTAVDELSRPLNNFKPSGAYILLQFGHAFRRCFNPCWIMDVFYFLLLSFLESNQTADYPSFFFFLFLNFIVKFAFPMVIAAIGLNYNDDSQKDILRYLINTSPS